MHPAAVYAADRLWQKSGKQTIHLGNCLQHSPQSYCAIGSRQCIGIVKVNLVLPRCTFMMHRIGLDAKSCQGVCHLTAQASCHIRWSIKITGRVMRSWWEQAAIVIGFKQKELDLRPGIILETHFCCLSQDALENRSRIAGEWLSIGSVHVTN